MATYDVGDKISLTALFKNSSATLTDPTVTKLRYEDPSGNETTLTYGTDPASSIDKTATGTFVAYLTLDEAGTWYYRWIGTGAVVAQEEGTFDVRAGQVSTT
jgi:hypothetical protein